MLTLDQAKRSRERKEQINGEVEDEKERNRAIEYEPKNKVPSCQVSIMCHSIKRENYSPFIMLKQNKLYPN
jgi:hypothetical protein